MALVSIVVPSFQQGQYIRATLDSILSQDFRDLECIVMDGASTDATLDVLRSCADPRLIWVSEPDRGQSHAINKGLQRATGQYLSYLNSDDLLRPGAVSAIVRYFEQHPEADFVYGDMDHVDGDGAIFDTLIAAPFDLGETLAGRNSVNQPGTFWRREAGERLGPFDESLHFSMDLEYWVRASLHGETIAYAPGIRSAFRYHGESKTVSRTREWLSEWDTLYARLEREYAHDPAMLRFLADCRARYSFNYAMYFCTLVQAAEVRPLIRRALREHPSLPRRVVAVVMLADGTLGTPFARWLRVLFRQSRGLTP